MIYPEIMNKVSQDTGINPEIVNKAYKAFWLYIRNSIQELPLKEDISEAEFLCLKPNFNIPSLGKMCCTFDKYKRVKKKFQYIKKTREKNEKTEEY